MQTGDRSGIARLLFWIGLLTAFVFGVSGSLSGSIPVVPIAIGLLLTLPHMYLQFQKGREQTKPDYPSYDRDFVHNLTWRCTNCGQEIYWQEEDQHLTCHGCDTEYHLTRKDTPELLRAKCWNCGEISTTVGGFRAENIRFDCPNCEFEWESSPW